MADLRVQPSPVGRTLQLGASSLVRRRAAVHAACSGSRTGPVRRPRRPRSCIPVPGPTAKLPLSPLDVAKYCRAQRSISAHYSRASSASCSRLRISSRLKPRSRPRVMNRTRSTSRRRVGSIAGGASRCVRRHRKPRHRRRNGDHHARTGDHPQGSRTARVPVEGGLPAAVRVRRPPRWRVGATSPGSCTRHTGRPDSS